MNRIQIALIFQILRLWNFIFILYLNWQFVGASAMNCDLKGKTMQYKNYSNIFRVSI